MKLLAQQVTDWTHIVAPAETGQTNSCPVFSAWNRLLMKADFIVMSPAGRARMPGKRTETPSIKPRSLNMATACSIIAL